MDESTTLPNLLAQARNKAPFPSQKLAEIIYDSKQNLQTTLSAFRRVEKALGTSNPNILPPQYLHTSRSSLLALGIKAGKITFEDGRDYKHKVWDYKTHHFALGNANPIGFNATLFIPLLRLQGSDEQVERWVKMAEEGRIVGSYCQTELGHGTHVSGLETTATFNPTTQSFTLHSPTISSIKYWPGAIGYAATHSIVMARLIISSKDYGIHGFIVQLRSLTDHNPLPAIELGDIGMKMSYNGTDNGYAAFRNVEVKREDMLCRYAQVSSTGEYTSHPLRQKLSYGGIMNGRTIMISHVPFQLAQALTIAVRYSTVRTQGFSLSTSPLSSTSNSPVQIEMPIIDYTHQSQRLLRLLSQAYTLMLSSKSSSTLYHQFTSQQKNGNFSSLAYNHMLTSGLKAYFTQTAADGAEEARKMCGGHGYMAISGLPDIVASVAATCTFEGENWVMWGQVGKYLVKGMELGEEKSPRDLRYVYIPDEKLHCGGDGESMLELGVLLDIFKKRAKHCILEAWELVKSLEGKGVSRANAENRCAVELMVASRAHIEVFILESAISQLNILRSYPSSIIIILTKLITLFALTTIPSPLAPFTSTFLTSNTVNAQTLSSMKQQIDILSQDLKLEMVGLTDAWSFTDACLASALGCWDGDVYKRIMEWTRQLEINVEAKRDGGVFGEGWRESIGPLVRGEGGRGLVRAKL